MRRLNSPPNQKTIAALLILVVAAAAVAGLRYKVVSDSHSVDTVIAALDKYGSMSPSYIATMTSNGNDNARVEHDAVTGMTKFTFTTSADDKATYIDKSAAYSCESELVCFRSSTGQENPADKSFSSIKDLFKNKKDAVIYLGVRDCPAGKCDAWSLPTGESTTTSTIYLDNLKRVSMQESHELQGEPQMFYVVKYTYTNVHVSLPPNAKIVDSPTAQN